jgi:uncharacterized Ntn-hydrolase superfamily protein
MASPVRCLMADLVAVHERDSVPGVGTVKWVRCSRTYAGPDYIGMGTCRWRITTDDVRPVRSFGRLSTRTTKSMTYSIVARDPVSGRFGVGIQTCWPFVGAGCPWVESGSGAVVTQSFTEVAHGPNGLALLRTGLSAPAALSAVLSGDPETAIRQVGIVDRLGRAAAHTGARCVAAAGHATADGVAVQANMMASSTVWGVMLRAYQEDGPFVERLLAALRAAEAAGGDLRGRQSAALVVSGTPDEPPWKRDIDLRVDDHPAPLDELERLVRLQAGFDALDDAERAALAGDPAAAARAGEEAVRLAPGDGQVQAWRAVSLAAAGLVGDARAALDEAVRQNPNWPDFLRRFADSGAQPALVEPTRRLLAGG